MSMGGVVKPLAMSPFNVSYQLKGHAKNPHCFRKSKGSRPCLVVHWNDSGS